MHCLMLLTFLASSSLVISRTNAADEPSGDNGLSQRLMARDDGIGGWSLLPGIADTVDDGLGVLGDAATAGWRWLGGNIGGEIVPQQDQPTQGNGNTRPGSGNNRPKTDNKRKSGGQKSPTPNAQVDESIPDPNALAPDYNEACMKFFEGVLKWAVCDSGNVDPAANLDVYEIPSPALPGYTTYTLYNSYLSGFLIKRPARRQTNY